MGLTTAGLVSHHGHAYIDTFENSVQVQLKVENEHGHSLEYAHIFWQVGFNLGKAKIQTDSHGKAHVYAPPGHLLALEADAHGCRSRLTVDEVKDEGQKIILICKDWNVKDIWQQPRRLKTKIRNIYCSQTILTENLLQEHNDTQHIKTVMTISRKNNVTQDKWQVTKRKTILTMTQDQIQKKK